MTDDTPSDEVVGIAKESGEDGDWVEIDPNVSEYTPNDVLREKIQGWRESDEMTWEFREGMERCADELEALLEDQ